MPLASIGNLPAVVAVASPPPKARRRSTAAPGTPMGQAEARRQKVAQAENLCEVAPLTEETVMDVLGTRFSNGSFYTFAGNTLVAINPFDGNGSSSSEANLFDISASHLPLLVTSGSRSTINSKLATVPSLEAVARRAFVALQRSAMAGKPDNQALILSGQSGAGKTYSFNRLLACLAAHSVRMGNNSNKRMTPSSLRSSSSRASVSDMVAAGCSATTTTTTTRNLIAQTQASNPVLEAFGNASTRNNRNSSRFGKYTELHLDMATLAIVGARMQTYLLERTRVVHRRPGDTNFHIFYHLISGCSPAQRVAWKLPFHSDYLGGEENIAVESAATTATSLQAIDDIMREAGISTELRESLFRALAAILHLGALTFDSCCSSPSVENQNQEEEEDKVTLATRTTTSKSAARNHDEPKSLTMAARLLDISATSLGLRLSQRSIYVAGEEIVSPLSACEFTSVRDSAAKGLYAGLFRGLVALLNENIAPPPTVGAAVAESTPTTSSSSGTAIIGLLDIFGFEDMGKNSLEQLCINYTNETLQQHYVKHILRAEQCIYEAQGLSWDWVPVTDNEECLELLDSQLGIFSLLDEECRLNRRRSQVRSTDLVERLSGRLATNPLFVSPIAANGGGGGGSRSSSSSSSSSSTSFGVRHYAGCVIYSSDGFIDKNKDSRRDGWLDFVAGSKAPILCHARRVAEAEAEEEAVAMGCRADGNTPRTPRRRRRPRAPTVVSKYRASLRSLFASLDCANPLFVRCIASNDHQKPNEFSHDQVVRQLRACGVLECVRISATGLPHRLPHRRVLSLFGPSARCRLPTEAESSTLLPKGKSDPDSVPSAVMVVLDCLLPGALTAAPGAGMRAAIGNTLTFLSDPAMVEIERLAQEDQIWAAVVVQASWKAVLQSRKYAQQRAAIIATQAAWRRTRARRSFVTLRSAVKIVQHRFRYILKERRTAAEAAAAAAAAEAAAAAAAEAAAAAAAEAAAAAAAAETSTSAAAATTLKFVATKVEFLSSKTSATDSHVADTTEVRPAKRITGIVMASGAKADCDKSASAVTALSYLCAPGAAEQMRIRAALHCRPGIISFHAVCGDNASGPFHVYPSPLTNSHVRTTAARHGGGLASLVTPIVSIEAEADMCD